MKFDTPERLKALVTAKDWNGQTLHFRKLTVSQWRELVKAREQIVKDETNEKDGFTWGALSLSKQLCDQAGTLVCDTDDWRERLAGELSADEMADLLTFAHTHSGVWGGSEQKKS
jgi:hypothetical protein